MLNVPHRRQSTAWSCGPACVRSILAYYGKRVPERKLIDALRCTPERGTDPASIALYLRKRGLRVQARPRSTMASLGKSAAAGWPTLVVYQDYGCCAAADLSTSLDHGHYSLVVGVDRDFVYLCDPSSKKKTRKIERATFLSRWRDIDASGRVFIRWALTVRPKT